MGVAVVVNIGAVDHQKTIDLSMRDLKALYAAATPSPSTVGEDPPRIVAGAVRVPSPVFRVPLPFVSKTPAPPAAPSSSSWVSQVRAPRPLLSSALNSLATSGSTFHARHTPSATPLSVPSSTPTTFHSSQLVPAGGHLEFSPALATPRSQAVVPTSASTPLAEDPLTFQYDVGTDPVEAPVAVNDPDEVVDGDGAEEVDAVSNRKTAPRQPFRVPRAADAASASASMSASAFSAASVPESPAAKRRRLSQASPRPGGSVEPLTSGTIGVDAACNPWSLRQAVLARGPAPVTVSTGGRGGGAPGLGSGPGSGPGRPLSLQLAPRAPVARAPVAMKPFRAPEKLR